MSKTKDSEQDRWTRVLPKLMFIAPMRKHCVDHNQVRQDLSSFVKVMKDDNMSVKSELEKESSICPKFRVRKQSEEIVKKATRYIDQTFDLKFKKQCDNECRICQKIMDPLQDVGYPCRVCNSVFHRKCIRSRKDLHSRDTITIDRAGTNTGWSCFSCGDLTLLLTEAEMNILMEDFDKYQLKEGKTMNVQQYIEYKRHLAPEGYTSDDLACIEFGLIDADKNGRIDWWEFSNHESKRFLAKRSNNDLVQMLTEKEVSEAKGVFDKLDENGDGFITESEAKSAFTKWYQRFEPTIAMEGVIRERTNVDMHAKQAADMVMEVDTNNTGNVSWEDFLWGQALYLICSRPNIVISKNRK